MNGSIDYYEVLEVHPKASPEIIRKAYVTLAKRYHPDVSSNADSERMALLNEAYEVLSNSEKRAEYDKLRTDAPNCSEGYSAGEQPDGQYDMDVDWKLFDLINKVCQPLIDSLNNDLIRREGNEKQNKVVCDTIMQTFSKEIGSYLDILRNCSESQKHKYAPSMDIVAITLWRIASGYTWAQEFVVAEKIIGVAIIYANPHEEYFKNLKLSADNIKINASKQRQFQATSTKSSFPWRLVGSIIAIALLVYLANSGPSQPAKSPAPVKPPVTQQTPPVELPNPKQGVITQYTPGQPILATNGYNEITIDNRQNDYPVYVRIWDINKNSPIRSFTIKQGQEFTAEKISSGRYQIKYVPLYANSESKTAYKSEPLQLSQKETPSGTEYSVYSLTLYKVRNGNTQTSPILLTEL